MTKHSIATIVAVAALGLLAACAGAGDAPAAPAPPPTTDALASYPPLPAGPAPGASPAARQFAASLGRGVNFGNMLDAPSEGAWGLRVDDRYIALAGPAGGWGNAERLQSVRLPVRWSNHASADAQATIDPVFMSRVDDIVTRLLSRGVPVVLDMHHYRQFDGDPVDAGDITVADAVIDARFFALWKQVAEHFRNFPAGLAFELYNEPHGRITARWNDLMSRGVRLVRQSNPTRVIVVGPTQWNSARGLGVFTMPPDANLVLTVHHYDPFTFTHQGATWVTPVMPTGVGCCSAQQLADIRGPLDTAQAWGQAHGYPVYVGEFGALDTVAVDDRNRYSRAIRDEMESRGMTWTYWELASGFGFYDPVAGAVRTDGLADALYGS